MGQPPSRATRDGIGGTIARVRLQTGGCHVFRNGIMKILPCGLRPCGRSFFIPSMRWLKISLDAYGQLWTVQMPVTGLIPSGRQPLLLWPLYRADPVSGDRATRLGKLRDELRDMQQEAIR